MSDQSYRLMFLASKRFESDKAVRGAFLLCDENTKPIEFRCTNPIRPSQLQSVLYGDILQKHIHIDLVGEPLVKSVKDSPDLIITNELEFLGLRPKIDYPLVLISSDEQIVATFEGGNPNDMLSSSSGRFEPIVMSVHSDFADDRGIAKGILQSTFNKFSLTEPFERISSALDQVHAQNVGDS